MSWILVAYGIVFVALAVGFIWYEKSRPTASLISLVAMLAAFAALSRVAFVPIPSVKPTTDIVLIAGYVFGGAPGFIVGSIGALTSNIMLGQGPWTPWQMSAWGIIGICGGLLAQGFKKSPNRFLLAVIAAVFGLIFGVVMNFSTWITYSGSHTLKEFLAISLTSVWFDVIHATGNFIFAIAFGPWLINVLGRANRRMKIVWLE